MVTLVVLPGLDGTGWLLADFVAALGSQVNVVVVTFPTDAPLGYSELESIARSSLPKDEPFFLLAESFSGPIAIAIAASAPPGLQGLVLCCSFARNPLPTLAPLRFFLGALPISALPVRWLSYFVLGRSATPSRVAALAEALAEVKPAAFRARAGAALSVDVSDLLARVNVPLLYLRAREDRVVSKRSCDLVRNLAAHTEVVDFGAPHFLLQVLPSPAAGAVMKFVGGGLRPLGSE